MKTRSKHSGTSFGRRLRRRAADLPFLRLLMVSAIGERERLVSAAPFYAGSRLTNNHLLQEPPTRACARSACLLGFDLLKFSLPVTQRSFMMLLGSAGSADSTTNIMHFLGDLTVLCPGRPTSCLSGFVQQSVNSLVELSAHYLPWSTICSSLAH